MNRIIAFFDFDGTITTRDTLLEFIKFSRGRYYFYLGFALNSPYLLAYKLKIISNQKAKERILAFFFGRMPMEKFQAHCLRFEQQALPRLFRSKALLEIRKLQEKGAEVCIVSASPENWIAGWATKINARLIATRLVTQNDRVTGRIAGKNCHGKEKVKRITEEVELNTYDTVYAYGDSPGDRPMMGLAGVSFYRPFR